ncbi:hypothetical protein C8J57DRAFT_1221956 [Mycena rebaudengoi]|nr:hypothetical protein C8J57DRAFT_1221956 [Mycena rebaudengoi]
MHGPLPNTTKYTTAVDVNVAAATATTKEDSEVEALERDRVAAVEAESSRKRSQKRKADSEFVPETGGDTRHPLRTRWTPAAEHKGNLPLHAVRNTGELKSLPGLELITRNFTPVQELKYTHVAGGREVFPPSALPLGLGCTFVASSNGNELCLPRACPPRLSHRDAPRLGGTRVACGKAGQATASAASAAHHTSRIDAGCTSTVARLGMRNAVLQCAPAFALTADEHSALAEMQPGSVMETRLSSVAQVRRERSVHAKTTASLVWGVGEGGRRERKKKETHENGEASS